MLASRRANPTSAANLVRCARSPSYCAPRAADVLVQRDAPDNPTCDVQNDGEGASLSGRGYISLGERLSLRNVRLVGIAPFIGELAHCPHLADLHRLDLSGNRIGERGMRQLAVSPHFGNLRELGLNANDLGPAGIDALLQAEWASNLTALELADNGLDSACANELSRLPHLTALDLSGNAFDAFPTLSPALRSVKLSRCGLRAIPANSIALDALTDLNLSFNPLATVGGIGDAISNLKRLDLSFTALDSVAASTLGRATALESLALRGNRIDARGAASLVAGAFSSLVELDLGSNPIGDDGAMALLRSETLSTLERLALPNCRITDDGVRRLVASGSLGVLRSLSLGWNAIGDAAAKALAACPDLAGLHHLDLTGTHFGFAGAIALVESPHFVQLRSLMLGENHRLPADAMSLLRERYNGPTE